MRTEVEDGDREEVGSGKWVKVPPVHIRAEEVGEWDLIGESPAVGWGDVEESGRVGSGANRPAARSG